MAPQQKKNSKKTASPKKIPAKKTALKKAGSKKLSSKTTPNKKTMSKKISPKKMSPQKKKTAPKKTVPKKSATKKPAPKKAALKKKVGESVAKENAQSKKMAFLKSSEERTARASRRGLAKDAPAAEEPQPKRARLDGSSDLVNLLTTSAGVLNIFAASGSRPLPKIIHLDDVLAMGGEIEVTKF